MCFGKFDAQECVPHSSNVVFLVFSLVLAKKKDFKNMGQRKELMNAQALS